MKTLLCLKYALLSTTFAVVSAVAAEGRWLTDYDAALKQAAAENKPLVVDFTGSDWCGWCIRLDKEVFDKPEFAQYAKDKVVLVKLDFPRKKEQSPAEKKRNREVLEKFGVEGFPTILVLNPKGEKVGELGYEEGGPKAWLASLDKIVAKVK